MIVINLLNKELFLQVMAAYDGLKKPEDPVINPDLYEDIYQEIQGSDGWVVYEENWHGFVVLLRSEEGLLLSPYFFGSIPMVEEGYEVLMDVLMEEVLLKFEEINCQRLYTVIKEQADSYIKGDFLGRYGIEFDYEYVEMQLILEASSADIAVPEEVEVKQVSHYPKESLKKCFDQAFASSDVKYYFNLSNEGRANFFDQVSLPGVMEHPCSLALENNGLLVGYAFIMTYHGQPYITSMCISEDYRGRGLGRYLINRISQEAIRQGYKTVSLGTELQMKAYSLYQSHGFKPVSSKRYYLRMKDG